MKYHKIMKKLIITLLVSAVIFEVSCRRPMGLESCTWTKEISGMGTEICKMKTQTSYENDYNSCSILDSLDTCQYNLLEIKILFETKYLQTDFCSSPHDSMVGNIKNITVLSAFNYNTTHKKNDTLNDILSVVYSHPNFENTTTPIPLNEYIQNKPHCTNVIHLSLTQPPDTTSLQSFVIIYKETDGTTFTDTTKAIYVTP